MIILAETFTEEKNFTKLENSLPTNYNWRWTSANRVLARGRASAGLVMGVRKDHKWKTFWSDQKHSINIAAINIDGVDINIIGVYCHTGVNEVKRIVEPHLEELKGAECVIVGDWNARTGVSDGRNSKDKVEDPEGKALIGLLDDYGYEILNGRTYGGWHGECTHVDYRSQSVIDYAAVNEVMRGKVTNFRVANKTQSDHFPIEIIIRTPLKSSEVPVEVPVEVPDFSPKGVQTYINNLSRDQPAHGCNWTQIHTRMWDEIPKKIRRSGARRTSHWWTTECYYLRKAKESALREARKDPNKWEDYRVARKKYVL